MQKIAWLVLSFLILGSLGYAQGHEARKAQFDIQHYRFELELSDQTNLLKGTAEITLQILQPCRTLILDLVNQDQAGRGMRVTEVKGGDLSLTYEQTKTQLHISLKETAAMGDVRHLEVKYEGIPRDGLIISQNRHGDRTFFGDNWPNRAHHWLPTVDHPSDKARVTFVVRAPKQYEVIANGKLLKTQIVEKGLQETTWEERVPIPTKVMVIGVADFAVEELGEVGGVPLSSWVFPQTEEAGFKDYGEAADILPWFVQNIAPFPYEKLANVQSKTRYGGMENAGNIFYSETSVTGEQNIDALLAHEIAHQWFGNSASEGNWHHIWLSEGFATYFADLYMGHAQGQAVFQQRLTDERNRVIAFHRSQSDPQPIVNTTVRDYNQLLNANSYQKGAWVLHMLRQEIGDGAWWGSVRSYYQVYQNANALTEDFQEIVEKTSGRDLDWFFQQWLYRAGHPVLKLESEYDKGQQQLLLTVEQVQKEAPFALTLPIAFKLPDGTQHYEKLWLSDQQAKTTFHIRLSEKPVDILLDPDVTALFEGE